MKIISKQMLGDNIRYSRTKHWVYLFSDSKILTGL